MIAFRIVISTNLLMVDFVPRGTIVVGGAQDVCKPRGLAKRDDPVWVCAGDFLLSWLGELFELPED